MRSADRLQRAPQSGVRKMMALAASRDDVVHLEVGESGFVPPEHIRLAAAATEGIAANHYSPTPGLSALREALLEKVRRVNGLPVPGVENILVSTGGANALFAIFGALLGPGDNILVPNPGWGFDMMVRAFGAEPRYYSLTDANGFQPDVEEMRALVDSRTRAVVLNSPSNPLGTVIPKDIVGSVLEFCEREDLWLISDECYDQIDFGGTFVSTGSLESALERVISVYSFSKVYAMTGWRVGYCVAPADVAEAAAGIMQASVLCPNTPAQLAALAALSGPQDFLDDWVRTYESNRDLAVSRIEQSQHSALRSEGGFYVWMKIGGLGEASAEEWAVDRLLNHAVAVTPGDGFGSLGREYVRVSYATDPANLSLGLDRLLSPTLG